MSYRTGSPRNNLVQAHSRSDVTDVITPPPSRALYFNLIKVNKLNRELIHHNNIYEIVFCAMHDGLYFAQKKRFWYVSVYWRPIGGSRWQQQRKIIQYWELMFVYLTINNINVKLIMVHCYRRGYYVPIFRFLFKYLIIFLYMEIII